MIRHIAFSVITSHTGSSVWKNKSYWKPPRWKVWKNWPTGCHEYALPANQWEPTKSSASPVFNFQELFNGTMGNWVPDPEKFQMKQGVSPYHGKAFPTPQIIRQQDIKKMRHSLDEMYWSYSSKVSGLLLCSSYLKNVAQGSFPIFKSLQMYSILPLPHTKNQLVVPETTRFLVGSSSTSKYGLLYHKAWSWC